MMKSSSLTQLAASVAGALQAEAPKQAAPSIPAVDQLVARTLGGRADRVLIYNPDCIGHWFWQKYTELFLPVQAHTQLAVPVATVMPSATSSRLAWLAEYTAAATVGMTLMGVRSPLLLALKLLA